MIQIQGSAVLLDKSEEMLKSVLKVYLALLRDGRVEPLPEGGKMWGQAIQDSNELDAVSGFLKGTKEGETVETSVPKLQAFVPEDEKFAAAVADLCNEGARKLHEYTLVGETSSCSSCCASSMLPQTKCFRCPSLLISCQMMTSASGPWPIEPNCWRLGQRPKPVVIVEEPVEVRSIKNF